MSQKLPLGVEIRLLEVFFSSSFKTVIAEADLSWRILESGLRLTNIADAHRSFTFLASLCLCFFSSFWAKNKINSLISPLFKHLHYILRVLKTSLWDPRCQTYVFKTKIAQGIQKWFQNNQLQTLPSSDFFKKNCFWCKKIIKKLNILLIFEFLQQYIWINQTRFKKINCRTFIIS